MKDKSLIAARDSWIMECLGSHCGRQGL